MLQIPLDAGFLGSNAGNKTFEVQRQNNGIILLNNLNAKLQAGGFDAVQDSESIFALSVDTFAAPKMSNNVIEVPWQNMRIKVAGAMVFDDVDITLKDFIDIDTSKMLAQWRLLVSNAANGAIGLAHQYKIDNVLMVMFGPDGSFNRYYQLDGVWLSRLDCGEIDMSADDYLRMTATLSCDRVIPLLALDNDGTNMPNKGAGNSNVKNGKIPLPV